MAKRFIDTEKHRKMLRGIDPKLRVAFDWLWANCDAAGVWVVDEELFRFETGIKLNIEGLLKSCPTLRQLPDGALFHTDFVEVNYGTLKPGYNPHKPVFRSLEAHGIEPLTMQIQGLPNPSPRVEEEDEDEDKEVKKERTDARDPEVQEVIDYLLQKFKPFNVATLDPDPVTVRGKTMDGNRLHAATLLKNMRRAYPDFKPMIGVKKLIDIAIADDFERSNCTKVHYLVKHMSRIIAKAPKSKPEPVSTIKPWIQ